MGSRAIRVLRLWRVGVYETLGDVRAEAGLRADEQAAVEWAEQEWGLDSRWGVDE